MASRGEDIILQPLWKIHNIDWSDRRNVFETDPSRPSLDLLRRNCLFLSRYDLTNTFGQYENYDKQAKNGKYVSSLVYPSFHARWSSFTADIVRTTA